MQIFDLFGSIRIEGVDTANTVLGGIGNTLTNLGDTITNLGNTLYDGITKPLLDLAIAGVQYNSSMEMMNTNFKVMLGSASAANTMMQKLKDMAAKTPFDTEGLAKYTQQLLAMGYTGDNVLPMLSKLGDISLGNSVKMGRLTYAVGQIRANGRLLGSELRQLTELGFNPLEYIIAKTGETMEEARQRMSDGGVSYKEFAATIDEVTSAGGKFYQGMEEGSKTLIGLFSTLKDYGMIALGQVTQPLFDFLKNTAIPVLTDIVQKIMLLSPEMKNLILIIAGLSAAFPILVIALGGFVSIVGFALTGITMFVGALTSVGFIIPAIVIAIGVIGGAITGLALINEDVRAKLAVAWDMIVAKVKDAANWIITHKEDIVAKLREMSDYVVYTLIPTFQQWWNKIVAIANDIKTAFNPVVDNAKELIKLLVDTVKDAIKFYQQFTSESKSLKEGIDKVTAAGDKNEGTIKNIAKATNGLIDSLKWVVTQINNVINALTSLDAWGKKTAKWMYDIPGLGSAMRGLDSLLGIEGYAQGTNYFGGGYALVGEQGPEIVKLNRGAQIFSNSESKSMIAGGLTGNVNIQQVVIDAKNIKDFNDVVNIFSNLRTEAVTRGGI